VKPVLAQFDRLAESTGAAVVYIHHDTKGAAGERDSRDPGEAVAASSTATSTAVR
jgi:RecA-family ATPase